MIRTATSPLNNFVCLNVGRALNEVNETLHKVRKRLKQIT